MRCILPPARWGASSSPGASGNGCSSPSACVAWSACTSATGAAALVPLAVASALWYGALVIVVARLAGQIDDVARILAGFNWGILGLAVLFVAFLVWVITVGRRHWHTQEHRTPDKRE